MIVEFSKNRVKAIWGIIFFNRAALLFFALCASAACYVCIYLQYDYVKLPAIPVSILGGALAIFLGFRNSSAYDRWWEARKIWGALVNDSRSFGLEVITYPIGKDDAEEKQISDWRRKVILRHIGWVYALNAGLRKEEIDLSEFLSEHDLSLIEGKKNLTTQIIVVQGNDIDYAFRKGWIEEFRFNALIGTLKKFYVDQGKAERIKNTIFPHYYNYFTLFFLWLFTLCLPFALANIMDNWILIPISISISFAFYILNKSGVLTETPFEGRASDTPLSTICRGIEIDLLEMLDTDEVPDPLPATKGRFGVLYQK